MCLSEAMVHAYPRTVEHVALRRTSKDGLAQKQHNVSKWGYMSIHGLLFQ